MNWDVINYFLNYTNNTIGLVYLSNNLKLYVQSNQMKNMLKVCRKLKTSILRQIYSKKFSGQGQHRNWAKYSIKRSQSTRWELMLLKKYVGYTCWPLNFFCWERSDLGTLNSYTIYIKNGIFTLLMSPFFHHNWVLSIGFVQKVPKLIQKMTMQKITEVNWKEHKKGHFWMGLPYIFSVFSEIIKNGDSEAIL